MPACPFLLHKMQSVKSHHLRARGHQMEVEIQQVSSNMYLEAVRNFDDCWNDTVFFIMPHDQVQHSTLFCFKTPFGLLRFAVAECVMHNHLAYYAHINAVFLLIIIKVNLNCCDKLDSYPYLFCVLYFVTE